MQWTSPNQRVVEWDTNTTHNDPGPLHVVVKGFPRYSEQGEALPIEEVIRLRVLIDFIEESFEPGNLPITGIHVIGHADTDHQKGKAFEQKTSEARAKNVQAFLKEEVEKNAKVNPRLVAGTPTATTIRWNIPKGFGAAQPNPENVKRGRTPSNMNEEDRKRNRRVEIILEPGLTAVQEKPLDLNLPKDYYSPGWATLPPPPPSYQPQKQREWLKDALQNDRIVRTLSPWLRDKVVDAGKDLDEKIANEALDALPIDPTYKGAVKAVVKATLQYLKGRRFSVPAHPPPQYQQPPSTTPPFPKAAGEVIIRLPPIKFR